jgi:sugar lactone lactonase YvrE
MKERYLILLVTIISAHTTIHAVQYEPYYFGTFAGDSCYGYIDGSAAAARFNFPLGVALDSHANAYVADATNNIIRKVTSAGTVSTLAGSAGIYGSTDGIGSAASFEIPNALAVDANDNIYIADTYNCTIRKLTPAGLVTTLAGSPGMPGTVDGTGSSARLQYPRGLASDNAGNIYVVGSNNANDSTVRKITPDGVVTTFAGAVGAPGSADGMGASARFNDPSGIAVDASNNVYVSDTGNNTIRKISDNGNVTTIAGSAGQSGSVDGIGSAARFWSPVGIVAKSDGTLYVSDANNNTIRKISPAGEVSTFAGHAGEYGNVDGIGNAARFNSPIQLALDSATNIYVADSRDNTIRKITSNAVVTTFAGPPIDSAGNVDGNRNAARFNYPYAVAPGPGADIYVADAFDYTVRKVTSTGAVTTLAGSPGMPGSSDGTGSDARFNYPVGIAADAGGYVYVADYHNFTVRKISPAGVVTTFAGFAGVPGSVDGTGSNARFESPRGLAIDNAGNVYVADRNVRKITPQGVVTTLVQGPPFFWDGVAVDSGLNVYLIKSNSGIVYVRRPDGTFTGWVQPTGDEHLDNPEGIAVDAAGNVYIADSYNQSIRKIMPSTPSPLVTTIAGYPNQTTGRGSTDGVGQIARFLYPHGVAVDSAGVVYIADSQNNTIRFAVPSPIAVSRKSHGNMGTFDIGLPLAGGLGIECRAGSTPGNHQIVASFVSPATYGSVSVTSGGGHVESASSNGDGSQVTVNIENVSDAQTIGITFFNFAHGNFIADVTFPMGILLGDTTGNGSVNASDLVQVKSKSGQSAGSLSFRADVTTNGQINASDVLIVKSRSGASLTTQ